MRPKKKPCQTQANNTSMDEASNSDYSTPTYSPDALAMGSAVPPESACEPNDHNAGSASVEATHLNPDRFEPRPHVSFSHQVGRGGGKEKSVSSHSQTTEPRSSGNQDERLEKVSINRTSVEGTGDLREIAVPPPPETGLGSTPSSSWDVSGTTGDLAPSAAEDDESPTHSSDEPTEMLAVARLVEDEGTMTQIVPPPMRPPDIDGTLAIQIARPDPTHSHNCDGSEDRAKARRLVPYYLIGLLVIAFLLGSTGLIVGLVLGKGNDTQTPQAPYGTNRSVPQEFSIESFIEFDLPAYSREAILADDESPQARAVSFLSRDPRLANYTASQRLARYSLAVLYHSMNGDTQGSQWNETAGWVTNTSECSWFTTSDDSVCDSSGTFTSLALEENELSGNLPAEIELLSDLQDILLTTNNINSTIPNEIGNLNFLLNLFLDENELSGTIPSTLGNIRAMLRLYLRYNSLTGTIPPALFGASVSDRRLARYSERDSQDRDFRGPNQGHLRRDANELIQLLERVDVGSNMLTGSIPLNIGMARNLRKAVFRENMLQGTVPASLSLLTNLRLLGAFIVDFLSLSDFISRLTGLALIMSLKMFATIFSLVALIQSFPQCFR
jgi:hypothetical protein